MPDTARPDRIGFYVTTEGDIAKIHVDVDRPDAWRENAVVDGFRERYHVIVLVGNQVTFLQGRGLPALEKIVLDWAV